MYSLENLNALRTAANMKPLKAWKESKAKLAAAIDKLRATEPVADSPVATVADDPVMVEAAEPADVANKVPAKKAVAKLAAAVAGKTVTLVVIAKELGLNPKVARAKMRRIKVPAEYVVGKHVYKSANKSWIVDALKKDHRKK